MMFRSVQSKVALLIILGFSVPFAPNSAWAEPLRVDGVRTGVTQERARVVLDLSGKPDYQFFRLGSPERLVVDLTDTRLSADTIPETFNGMPILRLRHARRGSSDLRVVVDLAEGEYQTRHFVLLPNAEAGLGYRLVLDVMSEKSVPIEDGKQSVAATLVQETANVVAAKPEASEPPRPEAVLTTLGTKTLAPDKLAEPAPAVRSKPRVKPRTGTLVDFSGTWQHEWAWAPDSSSSQKFESIVQPRWDVRFANRIDVTAILRIRGDAIGDLGPTDRRPPNYSDISAPWFNSGEAELSLRELFVDFQWGKTEWRLGKQQVVWGQADGVKVLDVVNPQSFREFILDDFDDSRIPLWTANVTVPLGEYASLQLLWIPDTTYHELAEPGAPFAFSTPRIVPQVPITALAEVGKPDNPFSDSDVGFALSGFAGGWDLSLNYLYRYLDAPVLPVRIRGPAPTLRLEPEYQRSHLLGGTFSNAFGDVTLRGELAYNSDTFQPTNTLSNDAIAESADFSALIGLDWALGMDALLSTQLFNSTLFDHVEEMGRDESEQTLTLLYQQDFANANWRFRGIGIHSLNDGDSQLQLKLSYWVSTALQVWVGVDVFDGDDAGLFGQFDQNDRALLGLEFGF